MKKMPTFLMESELYEQLSQIVANGSPMHIQITPCCGEIDVEIKSEVDVRCAKILDQKQTNNQN